jgi:hypothetical protein
MIIILTAHVMNHLGSFGIKNKIGINDTSDSRSEKCING